jgi:NADH:ubiquinone oxidoreductase subunit F (NADH-binding)
VNGYLPTDELAPRQAAAPARSVPVPVPVGIFPAAVAFPPVLRQPEPGGVQHQDLVAHRATYGPRPDATRRGGTALVAALERSALTGHGGGHFPVSAKWRAALGALGPGESGYVVANCAEGEPASVKDAALLQLRPHLVLDGLALAAETVGTRRAVVWLHDGDHTTEQAVHRAIAERRSSGPADVTFTVVLAPDHYLSGESSAVVRALSGGHALPYLARSPAAVAGIAGRPTLVHNAETLAHVALVALDAAGSAGPLITVVGPQRRAVVATWWGETFSDAVGRSGAVSQAPAAALVGGYGGTWLPWTHLAGLEVSDRALRARGASLGAGVVATLGGGQCGLAETARVLSFLAGSSARQCGPCVFGLPALTDLLERLREGRCDRRDLRRLDRYAQEIAGRGACHHPDGAVRLVRSALQTFAPDVRRHLAEGPCPGARRAPVLPVPVAG